jgi:pSer/pThr/pTyr-binding forkhead associated (FHA) protein
VWQVSAFDREGRHVASVQLSFGELTIGRDDDRQLVLPSASVSRKHARIVLQDGRPCIVDDGSSNGVLVNGVRISAPTAIGPTTRIDVAEFQLKVEPVGAPAPPPQPPPRAAAAQPGTFTLVAEGGPLDGRVFNVPAGVAQVGRAVDNDLVFDDPSLSRKHARLINEGQQLEVEDLGSSNGTYVNGRRVGRAPVMPGDLIRFGDLNFRVEGRDSGHSTRSVEPGTSRGQLIAMAAVGTLTFVLLLVAIILLVRRTPAVQASGRDAIGRIAAEAQKHLAQGQRLYREKKYLEAKSEIDSALELDPGNSEARKLLALAIHGSDDDRAFASATAALAIGDRKGLETALKLRGEMTEGGTAREQLSTRLSQSLVRYGSERCGARSFGECAWALCRAYEVAPADGKPDARALRLLKDAEKKLQKARDFVPCRVP